MQWSDCQKCPVSLCKSLTAAGYFLVMDNYVLFPPCSNKDKLFYFYSNFQGPSAVIFEDAMQLMLDCNNDMPLDDYLGLLKLKSSL